MLAMSWNPVGHLVGIEVLSMRLWIRFSAPVTMAWPAAPGPSTTRQLPRTFDDFQL